LFIFGYSFGSQTPTKHPICVNNTDTETESQNAKIKEKPAANKEKQLQRRFTYNEVHLLCEENKNKKGAHKRFSSVFRWKRKKCKLVLLQCLRGLCCCYCFGCCCLRD